MGYKEQVKSKILSLGTTVVITPIELETDDRGDEYELEGTSVTTKGVMDGFFSSQFNIQKYGDYKSTSPVLILAYDETIDKGYKIEFQDKEYRVVDVTEFLLSGVNLAYQCKLKESD